MKLIPALDSRGLHRLFYLEFISNFWQRFATSENSSSGVFDRYCAECQPPLNVV